MLGAGSVTPFPTSGERYRIAMACFVYILGCEDKGGQRTYVGWTTNLARRLHEHNASPAPEPPHTLS